MGQSHGFALDRRMFLRGMASVAAIALSGSRGFARSSGAEVSLVAAPAIARLGAQDRETGVWAYNGTVPGPAIRVRQGDRLRVAVRNDLQQETTVHWHGIRVPNEMDGVPHLTQPPIAPGETFVYQFDAIDAGTFWYHPHQRGFEQVERGLAGPLIVEERAPIRADRDLIWMLDDWRLLPSGEISDDFASFMDASHNGRVGNTVTLNGRSPGPLVVRRGERVRLRLVNAANARIFALDFTGHAPLVVAVDGQPVEPHVPDEGRIVLAPAMRIDLVIDFMREPGARFAVTDRFYRRLEYELLDIVYDGTPMRDAPLDAPVALAPNPLTEPDLARATRHEIVLGGGMMGRMTSAMLNGRPAGMRDMMRHGMAWAINGVAATGHVHDPMFELALGRSYVFELVNDTAWHHPMHLHGHTFRVTARNGRPTRFREWQDTVLLAPRERVEIAFVADNPGDWMFHCHILEHQAAGMMAVLRVA